MSFSDRPTLTGWQKFGCALVSLIGFAVSFLGLAMAALGHCAPAPDGTGCENDGFFKFLFFPGTAIVSLMIGISMIMYFMRDKD